MEKAIEKQIVKKEVVVAEGSYVKKSEMTGEDILKLPKFNANLIKQKTRRGQVQFKIVVQLDELLRKEVYLNEVQFNLIVLERKLNSNVPIQHLIVPVRLVQGVSVNGRNWKRYEFFVTKNVVLSGFFNHHEVALIDVAKLNLDFITSDEKIEDELINVFNEEDFI